MCCVHLPRTTGGRVISRCRRWTSQRPQWSSKIIDDTTNTWRNLDFFQRSSDHQIGIDRISEYPTFSRDRIPPIIIWGPHFAVESGIRSLRTWRKPSTFRPITWRSPSPCRPTWCRRAWKRWKSTRMKRLERATVPWNRFWRSGKGWTGLQRLKERLKVKNWRKGRCNLHARCVAVAVFVLPSVSIAPGCSAQGQCQQASEFRCGCEGKFDQSAVWEGVDAQRFLRSSQILGSWNCYILLHVANVAA